jgi:hypothetical protein
MAAGRVQRRQERTPRIEAQFPSAHVGAALDLLHLVDMAWHDCYGKEPVKNLFGITSAHPAATDRVAPEISGLPRCYGWFASSTSTVMSRSRW